MKINYCYTLPVTLLLGLATFSCNQPSKKKSSGTSTGVAGSSTATNTATNTATTLAPGNPPTVGSLDANFLTINDFTVNVPALSTDLVAYFLVERLLSVVEFDYDVNTGNALENACDKGINDLKFTGNTKLASFKKSMNCNEPDFNLTSKTLISRSCSTDSYQNLTGKSLRDLHKLGIKDLICYGREEFFTQYSSEMSIPTTDQAPGSKYTNKNSYSTIDGKPCVQNVTTGKGTSIVDGCTYFDYATEYYSDTNETFTALIQAKFDGVSGEFGKKFYNKGQLQIKINNWTGTVNFNDKEPTYKLNNGSETFEGTLKQDAANF